MATSGEQLSKLLKSSVGIVDLHDLIRLFGCYHKITPEAWAQFDTDMDDWRANQRAGIKDEQAAEIS